jgi:hypothetical protein
VRGQPQKALITTHGKKQTKGKTTAVAAVALELCLEKERMEMIKAYLPLCPLHYHECISGKRPDVLLKENYGSAKFNSSTQKIDYPASVPKHRFPLPISARKGLMMFPPSNHTDALVRSDADGVTPRGAQIPLHHVTKLPMTGGPFPSCGPGEIMRVLACKTSTATSTFYVDSGAGQCLSSCSAAFQSLEPCHIEVVGVAGSLSIFGIGTAVFAVSVRGQPDILIRIHNCLYSFGEFNLLSVSQMQTISCNGLDLSLRAPYIRLHAVENLANNRGEKQFIDIPLVMDDGLYAVTMEPVSSEDPRHITSQIYDITPSGEYTPPSQKLFRSEDQSKVTRQIWTTMVLSGAQPTGRVFTLAGSLDFHSELASFSDKFLAPAGIPPSRKQFDVSSVTDMSDLSIRFLGVGTDRILHTVGISNGLAKPPSKKHVRIPPLNFPQGNLKEFKTPRVSKDLVGHLKTAGIAEALYTDTFYTGDFKFPYAQVFVDRASRYGDVIPMRSRTEVGSAFVTFVCRHYTPLILISDNISENHGGDLVEQCRKRDVKQLFTCPYHPQMDFAEGYIGRITTMASFAMVYSGAPLFMWIWATKTAVFVNQIMASYYSIQKAWAAPYELIHGELFPDSSIVIPFGCGVLVLLPKSERAKFKSRCALMVFVHYADDHPLYTYAVYSPLTKRMLMRQDCIFLPKLFPMRIARTNSGMAAAGEPLIPFRSPIGILEGTDPDYSFEGWQETDPLPEYEDHVAGSKLTRPQDSELIDKPETTITGGQLYRPHHPLFWEVSGVEVNPPPSMGRSMSKKEDGGAGTHLPFGNQSVEAMEENDSEDSGVNESTSLSNTEQNVPAQQSSGVGLTQVRGMATSYTDFVNAYRASTGPIDFRFLPLPPPESPIFQSGGVRGRSFTIRLEFTGISRPAQNFRVYETMLVSALHYRIAFHVVTMDPRGIRLFVEDRILFHSGTISDRFDPRRPTVATPHLVSGSILEVRLVEGMFGVTTALFPPPVQLEDIDAMTEGDGQVPIVPIDPSIPPLVEIRGNSNEDDDTGMTESVEFCGDEVSEIDDHDPDIAPLGSQRRSSIRIRASIPAIPPASIVPTRRRVSDRWFYAPKAPVEKTSIDGTIQGSSSVEDPKTGEERINREQHTQLVKRFNVEGRNWRSNMKAKILQAWKIRANPLDAAGGPQDNPLADSMLWMHSYPENLS